MASEYAGALMCHQHPAGLGEIEVQRSGQMGVVSIAALSKTSPLTSAVTQETPASERPCMCAGTRHASDWVGGMSGPPWGSLNLQVDRRQLGS
jgi:hypothetical protein